jgi:hypothetical protein
VIRAAHRAQGEPFFSFSDMAVIRQADAEMAEGASFRAVLRNLLASRDGQLAFDFRSVATPAKILQLKRPEAPPMAALLGASPLRPVSSAEQYFSTASVLDDGDPSRADEALAAYRRALEIDPYLVPAIINLANIH